MCASPMVVDRGADFAGLDKVGGEGEGARLRNLDDLDALPPLEQLRLVLSVNYQRVIDLLQRWDEDGNQQVSKVEFRRALPVLGVRVNGADADALFDEFDADRSGEISYDELSKKLHGGAGVEIDAALRDGAAGAIELDARQKFALREGLDASVSKMRISLDPSSDVPVVEQLSKALGSGQVLARVIDIFREWDSDGSGTVEKREFARAMQVLGVDCERTVLDELFDSIDIDGSGSIEYKEIQKKIRKTLPAATGKSPPRLGFGGLSVDKYYPASKEGAMDYGAVRDAVEGELDAKRALTRLQRQLWLLDRRAAANAHRDRKRQAVQEVRRDLDQRVGRDLIERIASLPKADDEEVRRLSAMMNQKLHLVAAPDGAHGWFHLFRHIDDDGSGRISFLELERAVRQSLGLPRSALGDKKLQSLWRSLDEDASGYISAGEFGRFMKLGEPKPPELNPRARLAEQRVAASRADREEQLEEAGLMFTTKLQEAGVEPAEDGTMSWLSQRIYQALAKLAVNGPPEWYRFFKEMDEDASGLVTYREFERALREILKIGKGELPERKLQGVWLKLDEAKAGSIDAGTFGRFMRRAVRVMEAVKAMHQQRRSQSQPKLAVPKADAAKPTKAAAATETPIEAAASSEPVGGADSSPHAAGAALPQDSNAASPNAPRAAALEVRAWKPTTRKLEDAVDPRELEYMDMASEVRRAEMETARLNEEAKRIQAELKRRSKEANEAKAALEAKLAKQRAKSGSLPRIGMTRSASSHVMGTDGDTEGKRSRPGAKAKARKPPPLEVLKAYGLAGGLGLPIRSRSSAHLDQPDEAS